MAEAWGMGLAGVSRGVENDTGIGKTSDASNVDGRKLIRMADSYVSKSISEEAMGGDGVERQTNRHGVKVNRSIATIKSILKAIPKVSFPDENPVFSEVTKPMLDAISCIELFSDSLVSTRMLSEDLQGLTCLKKIRIKADEVTSLGRCVLTFLDAEYVELHANMLDFLPDEGFKFSNLKQVHIFANQLVSLPSKFLDGSRVETVYLSARSLFRIPSDAFEGSRVKEFYLSCENSSIDPSQFLPEGVYFQRIACARSGNANIDTIEGLIQSGLNRVDQGDDETFETVLSCVDQSGGEELEETLDYVLSSDPEYDCESADDDESEDETLD